MVRTWVARIMDSLQTDVLSRRLLSNTGWLLSANTASIALAFVQSIIVARALGVEQYGVLALITTYTTTVNQLVDSRVWETAIKYVIQYKERGELGRATAVVKLCYLVDAVTGVLAWITLLLTASWAARLFVKDPAATGFIELYAWSVIIAVPLGTSSALLRIGNHFDWLAYQNAGVSFIKFAGVLGAILIGGGIKEILFVYLVAAMTGAVILVAMSIKVARQIGLITYADAPLSLLRSEYRQIVPFLLITNANALFKLLQRNADVLLVGYWLTTVEIGYLRLARSITDLMNFPVNPLYTVSYPEIARLWHQQEFDMLWQLVRRISLYAAFVALSALAVIGVGGGWIIGFTVGPQYLPAFPVLLWLALATAVAIATSWAYPLLLAMGGASSSLLAIALGVLGQLAILLVLLPKLGVTAAGIAYLGFYVIWVIMVASAIIQLNFCKRLRSLLYNPRIG
jgi:O-antigen/teichoic acid export membrane protein